MLRIIFYCLKIHFGSNCLFSSRYHNDIPLEGILDTSIPENMEEVEKESHQQVSEISDLMCQSNVTIIDILENVMNAYY